MYSNKEYKEAFNIMLDLERKVLNSKQVKEQIKDNNSYSFKITDIRADLINYELVVFVEYGSEQYYNDDIYIDEIGV